MKISRVTIFLLVLLVTVPVCAVLSLRVQERALGLDEQSVADEPLPVQPAVWSPGVCYDERSEKDDCW